MLFKAPQWDVRDEAVKAARVAGELGAVRLPDTVLFLHGQELSDTTITRCLVALDEGRTEREHRLNAINAYRQWLAANHEQLDADIQQAMADGCADTSAWLLNRYFEASGVRL